MSVTSWISPKTTRGLPSQIAGRGFHALTVIEKNEIVAIKGGRIINATELSLLEDITEGGELGIAPGMYLAPTSPSEVRQSMLFINHSCNPNCGLGGNILYVAMRRIQPEEEITMDYCMQRSDPSFLMTCQCSSSNCRGVVTGNDWRLKELQERYAGYFSWYISQMVMGASGEGVQ